MCNNLCTVLGKNAPNGYTEIHQSILNSYNTDKIENDEDPEYFEKISTPKLTEKDETALLAADLCENKKISLTLFSQLHD